MEDLGRIYHEALAVGAACKDHVFLKRLKNMGMLFGRFDEPIDAQNSKASKKYKTPEVEDWEVVQWARDFERYFPESLFFDGVQPVKSGTTLNHGMISFEPEDYERQLKHWRDPIKQLKNIGGKQVTALIYFTAMGKVEEVEALIKMGADVNILSSSNDSALLIALQRTKLPECGPPDLRLFELISSVEHTSETLNMPTDKRKHTILGFAVDTQIPYVVDKVLSMGVTPDMRCDVDQITPLYKVINSHASLSSFGGVERMLKNPTPELLDSIRRHAPWLAGIDNFTAEQNISRLFQNPRYMDIGRELLGFLPPQMDKYSLMAIIESLLDHGADPNHLHNLNGWRGFTPLMLAAELNLPEVVKLLCAKGASSSLKASAPDGRKVDALDVAQAHGSREALFALRE